MHQVPAMCNQSDVRVGACGCLSASCSEYDHGICTIKHEYGQ